MNDPAAFELFDKLSDKFFIRLLIDVISMIILVRLIYFRIYKKKDYLFTFSCSTSSSLSSHIC